MFYLPGDSGIGKTGFYGNQPLLAFAFLEIVSKGGRQFNLGFKIKDFLFQRLGGAEVCAHGCVRIFDDVTLRFKFGKFFVHVAQGGSKFFQPLPDEDFRFKRRLVSFVLGNLVVNLDKVVERVFGFLRIAGRQSHLQKAGFLGVWTGNCQTTEQGVSGFKNGRVPYDDGFSVPCVGHQGGGMDGNGGKGKRKRFSVKTFQQDEFPLIIGMTKHEAFFIQRRDVQGAGSLFVDLFKVHQ